MTTKTEIAIVLMILATNLKAQEINIENRTKLKSAQIIAEIIAHEIMEFDTLNVILFPLPSNCTLEGAVDKNKCEPHTYTIFINESLSIKRLRVMLSHEFIHIKQYESEGLDIFGDIWIWKGEWGSMTFTEYDTRKFELDAYSRQWQVNKKLHKILKARK